MAAGASARKSVAHPTHEPAVPLHVEFPPFTSDEYVAGSPGRCKMRTAPALVKDMTVSARALVTMVSQLRKIWSVTRDSTEAITGAASISGPGPVDKTVPVLSRAEKVPR